MNLPASASDEASVTSMPGSVDLGAAYIRNPIADRPMLTPFEALDAISILAATLLSDERYREALQSREVPNGE